MKKWRMCSKICFIAILGLLLTACSSSKSSYYVLNPTFSQAKTKSYTNVRIGIDEVHIPEYLEKQPISIYCTPNCSRLDDNHQWVENIQNNIKRVIRTNLSSFLPGALVAVFPWDNKFHPNYHVEVYIDQFRVDIQGNSVLYGNYVLYSENKPIKNYKMYFHQKLPIVNFDTVVVSMNANLTRLTQDIAYSLRREVIASNLAARRAG